LSHAVIPRS